MGTWFHAIVDRDATGHEEAVRLERKVMDWLIADGIISAKLDDCVLGSEGGHRPGPRYAAALADPAQDMFLELRTNGVQAITQR